MRSTDCRSSSVVCGVTGERSVSACNVGRRCMLFTVGVNHGLAIDRGRTRNPTPCYGCCGNDLCCMVSAAAVTHSPR